MARLKSNTSRTADTSVDKYIDSTNIKMYPSSRRSDYFDRNSRLSSEQNLVSVINRLTNRNAFIVNGLRVLDDGLTISAGSCNIHGYLFNIISNIKISESLLTNGLDKVLYFKICIRRKTVNATDNTSIIYEELRSEDINTTVDDSNNSSYIKNVGLQELIDNTTTGKFTGLQIVVDSIDSKTETGFKDFWVDSSSGTFIDTWYYLPIAKIISTSGRLVLSNLDSDDDANYLTTTRTVSGITTEYIPSQSRWAEQSIDAKNVYIKALPDKFNVANEYYDKPQDLVTWLQNNNIIDDGRID